jgi:hypothetical protein
MGDAEKKGEDENRNNQSREILIKIPFSGRKQANSGDRDRTIRELETS